MFHYRPPYRSMPAASGRCPETPLRKVWALAFFGLGGWYDMDHSRKNLTRGDALKQLIVLPALAGMIAAGTVGADAADNKKQFHYQGHPGPRGRKCSGCRFFKKPNRCSIVTGAISPNGWCIAWAKR
jgi:hypothetical protein